MKPLYIVNYTTTNPGRTTETKAFDLLRDARKFAQEHGQGYITRVGEHNTTLVEYFGGFCPSAQEELNIAAMLAA